MILMSIAFIIPQEQKAVKNFTIKIVPEFPSKSRMIHSERGIWILLTKN